MSHPPTSPRNVVSPFRFRHQIRVGLRTGYAISGFVFHFMTVSLNVPLDFLPIRMRSGLSINGRVLPPPNNVCFGCQAIFCCNPYNSCIYELLLPLILVTVSRHPIYNTRRIVMNETMQFATVREKIPTLHAVSVFSCVASRKVLETIVAQAPISFHPLDSTKEQSFKVNTFHHFAPFTRNCFLRLSSLVRNSLAVSSAPPTLWCAQGALPIVYGECILGAKLRV